MTSLAKTHGIEAFEFLSSKNHPKIKFKHGGQWHQVTYSMSPRTDNQSRITAQKIRRIIKGKTLVH